MDTLNPPAFASAVVVAVVCFDVVILSEAKNPCICFCCRFRLYPEEEEQSL